MLMTDFRFQFTQLRVACCRNGIRRVCQQDTVYDQEESAAVGPMVERSAHLGTCSSKLLHIAGHCLSYYV